MKKFLKDLFNDDNSINEKAVVGFIAFIMMVITLATDIVTGVMGKVMPIQEFIFDGFRKNSRKKLDKSHRIC